MDKKDLVPLKPMFDITAEQRKKLVGSVTPNYNNGAMNQMTKELDKINRDISRRKEAVNQATIQTAENTAEMKEKMNDVILNQNEFIKLLRNQNNILKSIFVSGEDGVAVQKEVMQILQQQGNDILFKDKGLDAGVGAVLLAVQVWLKSKGIDL